MSVVGWLVGPKDRLKSCRMVNVFAEVTTLPVKRCRVLCRDKVLCLLDFVQVWVSVSNSALIHKKKLSPSAAKSLLRY